MTPGSTWTPRKIRDSTDTERIHENSWEKCDVSENAYLPLRTVNFNNIQSQKQRQMMASPDLGSNPSWGSLDCCPKMLPGYLHSMDNEAVRIDGLLASHILLPQFGQFQTI